jgi:hypothetical protein
VEKLAEMKEKHRIAARESIRRKRQQNQRAVDVNNDEMPTEEEAEESYQETLFDQACLLLERMGDQTRQKLFAFIARKYRGGSRADG